MTKDLDVLTGTEIMYDDKAMAIIQHCCKILLFLIIIMII